jgi:lipoyl(octanoyl) transferase
MHSIQCGDCRLTPDLMAIAANARSCAVLNLGVVDYAEACELQRRLVAARKEALVPNLLLLCEHPHVLTLGRNGNIANLRASERLLAERGVQFHQSNRGGDITYHGPGQIVGYPILQLAEIRRDVVWYVRQLEEIMIRTTAAFGIEALRVAGKTGIWVKQKSVPVQAQQKLGAIGVHISRWVTSHGFAYNVCTDLSYFDLIVPCGISGCITTSLQKLLHRDLTPGEVLPHLVNEFGSTFGLQMQAAEKSSIEEVLIAAGSRRSRVAYETAAD